MATEIPEQFAAQIFQKAIADGRAAELLECLFDGGSVTIDSQTGDLVMVTVSMLAQLGEG